MSSPRGGLDAVHRSLLQVNSFPALAHGSDRDAAGGYPPWLETFGAIENDFLVYGLLRLVHVPPFPPPPPMGSQRVIIDELEQW